MAREDRLIKERVDQGPLPYPILTTDHVKYIKDTIISSLRDMFSRDPDFTYIKAEDGVFPDFDNENLGVVITDVFGYTVNFLPAITIRVNGGSLMPVSFNQNQFTYDYHRDPVTGALTALWQEFSGLYDSSVVVNIHAWDPQTREELVTRLAILFQHLLRDQLYADFGLFVWKPVSIGAEVETPWTQDPNDMIFSQSISFQVLTGWNNRIPVGPPLEGINLQIIGDAVTPEPPEGVAPGGPCGGGGRWRVSPSKQDLEDSNRVDWADELKDCPELVLEDALVWDDATDMFIVTEDWLEVLQSCGGVTIEQAIAEVNAGAWLREEMINTAERYRAQAEVKRANKTQGLASGSPGNMIYRLPGSIVIKADDTVVFPNGVTVALDGTTNFPVSKITVGSENDVTAPGNVDLDAGMSFTPEGDPTYPFTATTFDGLSARNFFLILIDVKSPVRESQYGLNKLIDEFVADLTDPNQIASIEDVRTYINDLLQSRFLLNKTLTG